MENAWDYCESRGCKLASERPFFDGANEDRRRAAHGREETKVKPPAQPAGGSASGATKPPPPFGDPQVPRPPPPKRPAAAAPGAGSLKNLTVPSTPSPKDPPRFDLQHGKKAPGTPAEA
eukprot:2203930-Pyramimonas_sp.AAC.1